MRLTSRGADSHPPRERRIARGGARPTLRVASRPANSPWTLGGMRMASNEVDVLIVGGGPTGLMLAAGLAAAGVRCRVVDREPVRPTTSRALVVHARSLELLAKLGVADRLVARGRRSVHAYAYVNRRPAAHVEFGAGGEDDTPYPFALFVSQVETERVLDEYLAERGVEVERPVALEGFSVGDGGVRVRLRHGDGREEEIRARYLVGCDGAHSAVRKAAAIPFEGAPYPQDFILADIDLAGVDDVSAIHVFVAREGLLAAFPLGATGQYRLIGSRAGDVPPDVGPPALDEFRALAARVCPFPLAFEAPRWLARFRLHHRLAARYRQGPVFLAGDAAHIHSPAGGQGMNTGLQDAANLAWKLALVVGRHAPEALLDSYEAERRPVGRRLLRTTDRLFALAVARNPIVLGAAAAIVPRIAPRVLGSAQLRGRAFRFLSQLDIAYPATTVVGANGNGADAGFARGPAVGQRAPDAPVRLADERAPASLFTLLTGHAHHLLVFAGPGATAVPGEARAVVALAAARSGWVETHVVVGGAAAGDPLGPSGACVDHSGAAHRRYGLGGPGYYLIRPDGHVACRAASLEAAPLAAYLGRLLPEA